MSESVYIDTRETYTPDLAQWKYWLLLAALLLGPLYVLLLPVMVA